MVQVVYGIYTHMYLHTFDINNASILLCALLLRMVRSGDTVVAASEHTYSIVTGAIVSLHIKDSSLVLYITYFVASMRSRTVRAEKLQQSI